MLKIMELRARSKQQLGTKFDVRDFHDVVLKNGALLLEQVVNEAVSEKSI